MRRILGFYFAILALTVTGLAAQESGIAVSYERLVLPNGLNVILHEDHTTPMVAVNVWYHVGSGREQPGRTGFAHLFEHIMFEGSGHVAEGKFDEWLEAAGGVNNGSTNTDRTNYFETVPNSALELALFLESDRMGYLLDAMSPAKVDGQRDVVKNERRFRIENRPYGQAFIAISENLYPPDHPYHWPVIGSMEDLTAASYEDVVQFHQTFYVPSNASLSIAGDIDPEQVKRLVQHWFGDVAAGAAVAPLDGPAAYIAAEKRVVMEDRVQLPRIYMCWLTPRLYPATPSWTLPGRCYRGERTPGCTSGWCTTCRSRRTSPHSSPQPSSVPSSASCPPPGAGTISMSSKQSFRKSWTSSRRRVRPAGRCNGPSINMRRAS